MTLFELGKEAGKAISRSVHIKLRDQQGPQQVRDALHSKKTHNSTSPWRMGRKPPKRKKSE